MRLALGLTAVAASLPLAACGADTGGGGREAATAVSPNARRISALWPVCVLRVRLFTICPPFDLVLVPVTRVSSPRHVIPVRGGCALAPSSAARGLRLRAASRAPPRRRWAPARSFARRPQARRRSG